MADDIKDPAPVSPVQPVQLGLEDTFRFRCHKGIPCFNKCCENIDIMLTPYDIVRLRRRMGIDSREFIDRYTTDYQMDGQGMPGLKLARKEASTACVFLTPEGCGVYEDRPSACRYYALGLLSMRRKDAGDAEDSYFVVKEDHCLGHFEPHEQTIREYRAGQGIDEYDAANREWRRIVLRKRSSGPTVGTPTPRSFELFFLASYDLDGFRRFVTSEGFDRVFDLEPAYKAELAADDEKLLQFAWRFLNQALFGDVTIALREGVREAREPRYRERLLRAAEEKAQRLADAQDGQYESLKE